MGIPLRLDKAVTVVETAPYYVLLEDVDTQRTAESNRMVYQSFTKSAPVKSRLKKQPTNLITDESYEPEWLFVFFQNPSFRVWKVDVTQILSDLRHEVICQKRMRKGIRFLPDLDKRISIFSLVLSDHCFEKLSYPRL